MRLNHRKSLCFDPMYYPNFKTEFLLGIKGNLAMFSSVILCPHQ